MTLYRLHAGTVFRVTRSKINPKLECQVQLRRFSSTSQNIKPGHNEYSREETKLIYEGKLSNRILYLKSISILSSVGLASSYSYVINQKGFSVALAGMGLAFTPFLLSPFIIAWFFKRYVTRLYYNRQTDKFTVHHYGLLLNKKSCTFSVGDVIKSEPTSMLNTFSVGKKPFFLHDEDLIDAESVELYKRMIGLEERGPECNK